MGVSELLGVWKAAHLRYRQALPHMRATGATIAATDGDVVAAQQGLTDARDALQAAHREDPFHEDPAWTALDYAALRDFYVARLDADSPISLVTRVAQHIEQAQREAGIDAQQVKGGRGGTKGGAPVLPDIASLGDATGTP